MKYRISCRIPLDACITRRLRLLTAALFCGVLAGFGSKPENLPQQKSSFLPLSPLPVGRPDDTIFVRPQATIQWQGHEYDVETAMRVLVDVIRNSESAKEREDAIDRLGMAGAQLRGTTFIDDLIGMFSVTNAPIEKAGILLCLAKSHDPRALPLFFATTEKKPGSDAMRLFAAAGLAEWNIRRGVVELVALCESEEEFSVPAQRPRVGDNALVLFEQYNRLKGWGCPLAEIREGIGKRGVDVKEAHKSYGAQIREWFSANEHRFPDWKPDDPLPEFPKRNADGP